MTPALLAAYALGLSVVGPRVLERAAWAQRHASAAIVAWHCLVLTVLGTFALALLTLAHDVWEPFVAWVLAADPQLVHGEYVGSAVMGHGWDGVLLLPVAFASMVGVLAIRGRRRNRRRSSEFSELFHARSASRLPAPNRDVLVVADEDAWAVCLARPRCIAVSTAAVNALDSCELDAVVAHERAHLAAHHLGWLAWAETLCRTIPWWPLPRRYRAAIAELHEMHADDRAAVETSAVDVAQALLRLSSGPNSCPGRSFGHGDAFVRAMRLLEPSGRASAGPRLAVVAVVIAIPAVIALMPAFSIVGSHGHAPLAADVYPHG